ncbi:MAG: hypothetical protein JSS30_01430 [Verrucomicrobia bacterium]|nr:hypothetical protein [Verrucomicrobiota bacterium]
MQALKRANQSISLQIYELSDPSILALLQKKHERGIEVKIFHDKKRTLPKGLPAQPVKSKGLMHRKILVIDGALVLLGTANFTTQSLKMHDNLILGLWHPELATTLKGTYTLGTIQIGCYLLPEMSGPAITALGEAIEGAKQTIQVAMFTLTHPDLVGKLANAQKRGVKVTVAIDRYTAMGASKKAVEQLQEAGAEILLNQGSQLLHHKWAIIDSKTLVLGSANWTAAAFAKNHDCLLILENLPPSEQKVIKVIWKQVAIASEKL